MATTCMENSSTNVTVDFERTGRTGRRNAVHNIMSNDAISITPTEELSATLQHLSLKASEKESKDETTKEAPN